jgi:hypothetical protein
VVEVVKSSLVTCRFYECANHLGNVLITISDRKKQIAQASPNQLKVRYYKAIVINANDYYPYGMTMPGRTYYRNTKRYRYGFNGQERSREINAAGNNNTAEFWQYDARVARRWNVDPIYKHSPYECFGGNPIWFNDLAGLDTMPTTPVFKGTGPNLASELRNNNIGSWLDLLNFRVPAMVLAEMNKRRGLKEARLQLIHTGYADATNFDYYSVKITKLPDGINNAQELFEYIRVNFTKFITGTTTFKGFNSNEKATWLSKNPLGAVMSFDESLDNWGVFNFDDASVLTSAYYSGSNGGFWNFSTLNTPNGDYGHPVSGTRQFGVFETTTNGRSEYTFFTRGVDRVADATTNLFGSETVFSTAHKTWISTMNNVVNYVNSNSGTAVQNINASQRLSWNAVVYPKYESYRFCKICRKYFPKGRTTH